ncbi:GntR family transcriptional regulator [Sinomonas mesophila]|uniref:GntR family transcriptional regulator n=1 Tax=Sinomonas mesophila TaxID=1531955 RepID=UPI0009864281|nr:GntR family transcriptional regulator [Sinomonas mesophila]
MAQESTDTARAGRSLASGVYEWLRERIIDGTLAPGERIREREVAEDLRVSRIPVREALPQLESEGYIVTLPRRGAVVTHMTVRDVTELFDVRSSLEVLAARLASEACTAGSSPAALEATLEEAARAVAAKDAAHIADVNARLHEEILALSGNRLLDKLMAPVSGHVRRLFHIASDRDQDVLHAEHVALVQAIVAGHADLAAALAFAHVEHSRNECLPIVEGLLP